MQTQPLATLEPATTSGPLFVVAFSCVRPLVFAVAGADGSVYMYDLQVWRVVPCAWCSVLANTVCVSVF